MLPRDLSKAVIALTAESPARARLEDAGDFYRPVSLTYEELIEALTGDRGEALKLIARYHAVEIGLRADAEDYMRPADEESGWIDSLRELATKMQRDFPRRTDEAPGNA